jgi:hypothetical protein
MTASTDSTVTSTTRVSSGDSIVLTIHSDRTEGARLEIEPRSAGFLNVASFAPETEGIQIFERRFAAMTVPGVGAPGVSSTVGGIGHSYKNVKRELVAFCRNNIERTDAASENTFWGCLSPTFDRTSNGFCFGYSNAAGDPARRTELAFWELPPRGYISDKDLEGETHTLWLFASDLNRAVVEYGTLPSPVEFQKALLDLRIAPGEIKREARRTLASLILSTDYVYDYLEGCVRALLHQRRAGRVDAAVELFAEMGNSLNSLIAEALRRSVPDANDADFWYAIVRAFGRVDIESTAAKFGDSSHRFIREAVVEALGDKADEDPSAKERLRVFAERDDSPFIRKLARDLLP